VLVLGRLLPVLGLVDVPVLVLGDVPDPNFGLLLLVLDPVLGLVEVPDPNFGLLPVVVPVDGLLGVGAGVLGLLEEPDPNFGFEFELELDPNFGLLLLELDLLLLGRLELLEPLFWAYTFSKTTLPTKAKHNSSANGLTCLNISDSLQ